MNTLAIDIGGTKFTLALFQEKMVRRESRATNREGGRDWMLDQIGAIVAAWRREFSLDACGIGFGGPVDFTNQRIVHSTHVGGWSGFDLPDFIRGLTGEGVSGAGRGFRPLFYMTLSTGIGGGILAEDEKVYRGADSYAGEIGHLTIRPDGPECLCGARGCFERMCCGLWLEKDHGRSAKDLFGDPAFVSGYVVDLALGLKAAIMLLNPARIVIGGGIGKAGAKLFVPLEAELRRTITDWSRARIDVVPAALGDDSVLYGARVLAEQGRGMMSN